MIRKLRILAVLMGFFIVLNLHPAAHAALNAVDPGPYTAATGFYPRWYQDTAGIALELCLSKTPSTDLAAAGLGGVMCILPPLPEPGYDPALPISFPGNFPGEAFWFTADARARGTGIDTILIIAVEAAFGADAIVNGDQLSFARVRIRASITPPATPGVYTFTHPYGVEVIEVFETGSKAIRFTRDIGIGAPGDFTGALDGDIGPFLVATNPLGIPSPIVIGAETFLGDPNVRSTVTGSPFGTNYFRVQGPGGIDIRSDLFGISGKVFTTPLPTPVLVDRASYSRTAPGTQMDVFAIAPAPATLSFTDSSAPPQLFPMEGDPLGEFFGQATVPPAVLGPVNLTASNNIPYNNPAFPTNSASTRSVQFTDLVFITKAEYSIATQTLVIEAASSDEQGLITLAATGFGALAADPLLPAPATRLTVAGVAIPPAAVTVTSSAGGSDTEEVVILP